MKQPNSKYMLVNIRVAVLRHRIRNFVEDVVDNYSEAEFRENFRMYRTTFNHILDLVSNKISNMWLLLTTDFFLPLCGPLPTTGLACLKHYVLIYSLKQCFKHVV
jgi:hypothetical protein